MDKLPKVEGLFQTIPTLLDMHGEVGKQVMLAGICKHEIKAVMVLANHGLTKHFVKELILIGKCRRGDENLWIMDCLGCSDN